MDGPMQDIAPSAWVAPSAQLFGAVAVGSGASVWHNVVMRAECHAIRIGRLSNVQDFVMIHVAYERGTAVGDFCSVTHHVTLHGCTVEDECLIGIGATIMDGAVIGRGSIVAGGAFVREGMIVPPGSIVAGVPAKVIRQRDAARENRLNAWQYHRNADHYRRGLHRAWEGPEYEAWLAAKRAEVERDEDLG
jgi:carbonic anhydrase/acetyltransferase-like protein (isoleucine patch superfamily)